MIPWRRKVLPFEIGRRSKPAPAQAGAGAGSRVLGRP